MTVTLYKKIIQLTRTHKPGNFIDKVALLDDKEQTNQRKAEIGININPFSKFNLLNENLLTISEQYDLWRDNKEEVNFDLIQKNVFSVRDIKSIAQELLDILAQMLVKM